jgi:hypothetical protein
MVEDRHQRPDTPGDFGQPTHDIRRMGSNRIKSGTLSTTEFPVGASQGPGAGTVAAMHQSDALAPG